MRTFDAMPRPRHADTRYLELHNGRYRVTVAVPRALHGKLGTRLKRPLHTDSRATANALKWAVVAELRGIIDRAASGTPAADSGTREALEIAAHRATVRDPEELEQLDEAIARRADEMRGDPIATEADAETGGPVYIHDQDRESRAGLFHAMATGKATPIDYHHPAFLAAQMTKARTKGDDRRAIAFLKAWCDQTGTAATLEAITRKETLRFHDALAKLPGAPASPVTLNKYLGRLSRYWQWLRHRELVETDPWERIKLPEPKTPHDELERPFTDDEVRKLLTGPASPAMRDLMMIAALTGARLEAIVDLRAKDCEGGMFIFKPQKKEKTARGVPIHSALADLVARRTKGKSGAGDLFPEYPIPKRSTSQRERSFRASNEFTAYRRSVGVEQVVPGRRRSLVNFHSFRRYFITKAEQADQMEHIIAVVVGHKRTGMTLGRYSGGPLLEQARRCVEAVKLPALST
jgi:site-specific recombinase XerC